MIDELSNKKGNGQPGDAHQEHGETIDLTKFDDAFRQASVEEKKFEPVPDGKYVVEIEEVKVTRNKDGKEAIEWRFKIIGPKYGNRRLWRRTTLEGDGVRYAKADLYAAGLKLAKISDLQMHAHELIGRRLDISVRNKHDGGKVYSNVYINQLLPAPDKLASRGEAEVGELGMF